MFTIKWKVYELCTHGISTIYRRTRPCRKNVSQPFSKFCNALLCAANFPISYLLDTMALAMRRYFVRRPILGVRSEYDGGLHMKPGLKETDPERRLFDMFDVLRKTIKEFGAISLTLAVGELDCLIQAEPRARALVSTTFASLITELSILIQCLEQLSLYQPWASSFEHKASERLDVMETEWMARRVPLTRIRKSFLIKMTARTVELGTPVPGRLTYPAKKRRTKETMSAMRLAERNLDVFWAAVDRVLYSSVGKMRNMTAGKFLAQPRLLQRTPPWVEPEVPTKETSKEVSLTEPDMKQSSDLFCRMS